MPAYRIHFVAPGSYPAAGFILLLLLLLVLQLAAMELLSSRS
jgi:hypothetical protein